MSWKRQVTKAKVDALGTSQTCPICDAHVPKDLSVRIHQCPECMYITDRDVASAQVIVKRGVLAAGQAVSEIACGGDAAGTGFSLASTRRGRKTRK